MELIAMERRMMKILTRSPRKWAVTAVRPLLPLLGPFIVSLVLSLLFYLLRRFF